MTADPSHEPPELRFLRAIWGAGIHSLCKQEAGRGFQFVFVATPEAAAEQLPNLQTADVWIGAHPLTRPAAGRGSADLVAEVVAIPTDLDWDDPAHRTDKTLPTQAELRAGLARLDPDLAPSVIVNSGHGLQAWWLLAYPVDPHRAAQLIARLETALEAVGLENGRPDLASILRLPGTINHKTIPVPVQFEQLHLDRRFVPEWLEKHLPAGRPNTPSRGGDGTRHIRGSVTDTQQQLLAHMIEHHGAHHPGVGPDGRIYITRPGKNHRAGRSATIWQSEKGDALLTVFSDNWPELPKPAGAGWATWQLVNNQLYPAGDPTPGVTITPGRQTPPTDDENDMVDIVDWDTPQRTDDPIIEGLIIPGRWLQIVAAAKTGKSTPLLYLAVELSDGRHPFDGDPLPPIRTLYCDGEMGHSLLRELFDDLGVDPRHHPNLLSVIERPRLDTPRDTRRLLNRVDHQHSQLVILDGLNGFVGSGSSDNDDNTWKPLVDTVTQLKRRSIAVLSADNLGKDQTRGPRGSSVKMDKADAVMILTRTDGGIKLRATHARGGAYTEELYLATEGHDRSKPIRYWRAPEPWPAGTAELVDLLDKLAVPLDAGRRAARTALKDAGQTAASSTLDAALRWRRHHPLGGPK